MNRITSQELLTVPDWAGYAADRVISVFPDLDLYTCAAGISPSGVVHFGNFRDIMIAQQVKLALEARGKKARLLFSWDEFDRFRKVPVGVPDEWREHIGKPLVDVPDPFCEHESYARHFEVELENALKDLGIDTDYRYQAELYRSGIYADGIRFAMQARAELGEILWSYMSEKARSEKYPSQKAFLDDYYPANIYSEFTGKDNTEITHYDGKDLISYKCLDTGNMGTVDLTKHTNIKLAWKADWPMRWVHEGVVFEPGGVDHAAPNGSYTVGAEIMEKVFEKPAPVFVGYGFISIQGLKEKMSSSKGNALTPGELLEIYTPELLKWIYTRVHPRQPFALAFDSDIFRQYDEFDKAHPTAPEAVPFRQLVGYGQVVNWNFDKLMAVFAGEGVSYDEGSIRERLPRAKAWLEKYNAEEMIALVDAPRADYYSTLDGAAKAHITALTELIRTKGDSTIEQLTEAVYAIPKDDSLSEDEIKVLQRNFFKHTYQLLFAKDRGPRLGTYLWAVDASELLKRLEF
jgi:lysyl-tRNA synthetase class 1